MLFLCCLLGLQIMFAGDVGLSAQSWQVWSPAPTTAGQFSHADDVFLLSAKTAQSLSWNNGFAAETGEYILTAEIQCEKISEQATIGMEAWGGGAWKGASFAPPLKGSCDFTPVKAKIKLPEGTQSVKAVLIMSGTGTAQFRNVKVEKVVDNFLLPAAVQVDGNITMQVTQNITKPVNRRLFGAHYFDIRDQKNAYADMGMTLCREGGPGFFSAGTINPDGKKYNWEALDSLLDWSKQTNVELLGLLGGPTAWMIQNDLKTSADWQVFYERFSDFSVQVVKHVNIDKQAGVKYWEIWNEPDGGHWFGKPWHAGALEYAPLFVMTAKKLKAVNPGIQIGTGGIADPFRGSIDNWWVPVAKYPEAAGLIDFVAIHGYYGDPANQVFANGIDYMRETMHKVLGREVPLWITEFNVHPLEDFTQRGYNFSTQALMVAEYLALFAQKDIESSQYFCVGWWESDFAPWDAATKAERPVFKAYQFWKDFAGERVAVNNPNEKVLPAVACKNDGSTILYVPARNMGKYRFAFDGFSADDKISVTGFYGDSTNAIKFNKTTSNGRLVVEVEWPQGSRALLKVKVSK